MHPNELIYLMSPDDLIKAGRYDMALAKLNVLIKASPDDKKLKKLVWKCKLRNYKFTGGVISNFLFKLPGM
jgi:hypothetical protein